MAAYSLKCLWNVVYVDWTALCLSQRTGQSILRWLLRESNGEIYKEKLWSFIYSDHDVGQNTAFVYFLNWLSIIETVLRTKPVIYRSRISIWGDTVSVEMK